ncbi:MAG TPA: hypothetical protein VME23_12635 [Terracidiphilus sp.]|nr:hypothetical protein [Terracidiphilus sp.]
MARHLAAVHQRRIRENDSPRNMGGSAPEFSVDEIRHAAQQDAQGSGGRGRIHERKHADMLLASVEADGDHHPRDAAVAGHTALPYLENHQRMMDNLMGVVQEAITEPSADDHTESGVHDEGENFLLRNRQPALARPAGKNPGSQQEAGQVSKPVPADAKVAAEVDQPWIEPIDPVTMSVDGEASRQRHYDNNNALSLIKKERRFRKTGKLRSFAISALLPASPSPLTPPNKPNVPSIAAASAPRHVCRSVSRFASRFSRLVRSGAQANVSGSPCESCLL